MRKLIMVLIFVFSLTGCAGVNDWSYKLPNNYEVWRINSDEIVINNVSTHETVSEIRGFLKEFSYDSRYVFTRNISDVFANNILDERYYILDTENGKVYGAFDSIEELQNQCDEMNIKIPDKWLRTSPDPNTIE